MNIEQIDIEQIDPDEAFRRMQEGAVFLDVRSTLEFARGHAAGAVNVPLLHADPAGMVPNEEFTAVCMVNFPPDTLLVVGCAMGGRSQRACEILAASGFTRLANVQGGFSGARDRAGRVMVEGWVDRGLPVAETPAPGCDYAAMARKLAQTLDPSSR